MSMNLDDLKKPFSPARISWRVGSVTKDQSKGMALAYLDARDVQDRLDEVCGVAGWQCRFPHAGQKTVCEIGVLIHRIPMGGNSGYDEWIWKADGAGDSDIEAEKGALSDAFKRSAVKWGIGRYLYDLESPWVALDGKKIAAHEYKRLEALLAGKAPQTQAQAIHTPHTMKPEPPVPGDAAAPAMITPQAWAQKAIDRVSAMDDEGEVIEFETKYRSKILSLSKPVPDLHIKLVQAIANKLNQFGQPDL